MSRTLDSFWQKSRFVDQARYDNLGEGWKADMRREEAKIIRGPGVIGTPGCNPLLRIETYELMTDEELVELRNHIVDLHNAWLKEKRND